MVDSRLGEYRLAETTFGSLVDATSTPPTSRTGSGWTIELTHPDGDTITPVLVEEPQFLPRINGLPRIHLPVERDEKWLREHFEHAPLAVWKDGHRIPIDELSSVKMQPDHTRLVGLGGIELLERVEREYATEEGWRAAQDILTETTYTAYVDAASGDQYPNQALQSAASAAEWDAITTLAATDPVVAGGSLAVAQTGWVWEGETEFGTGTRGDIAYSGGSATYFGGQFGEAGDVIEYTFTPQYRVPAENVRASVRFGAVQDGPPLSLSLNGYSLSGYGDRFTLGSLGWRHHTGYSGPDLQAGESYTFRMEQTATTDASYGEVAIDVVAVTDDRYSYTWDNQVHEADGYLDGPELYPDAHEVALDYVNAGYTVETATGTVTSSTGVPPASLALQVLGGPRLSSTGVSSLTEVFSTTSTDVRGVVALGRYGVPRGSATPRRGYAGHSVSSWRLEGDLSDAPLLIDQRYDGPMVGVLQDIADDTDSVFEVQRGDAGNVVVWTRPGERTSDSAPAVVDYEVTKSTEETYDEVVIYGGGQPVDGERFTAVHDASVDLVEDDLIPGGEVVYDAGGESYDPGDYRMDYSNGAITALGSGGMSDGGAYRIDYEYKPSGSATSGVSNPSTLVRTIPNLVTDRACGQAASILLAGSQDPVYEATVVLPRLNATQSLVESLLIADLPTGGSRLDVRNIQHTPSEIVVELGSGQSVGDLIGTISQRLSRTTSRV